MIVGLLMLAIGFSFEFVLARLYPHALLLMASGLVRIAGVIILIMGFSKFFIERIAKKD
jgi:hypothetical protein